MPEFYLPSVDAEKLIAYSIPGMEEQLLQLLAEPLHEELYKRQTFDLMDELTEGQQLMLCFDYARNQIAGGGVIQLLHNGYVGLLVDMPQLLAALEDIEMSQLTDDIMRFYVQHRDRLEAELTVDEFARLYNELPEAEALDNRFNALQRHTVDVIAMYAKTHIEEFVS